MAHHPPASGAGPSSDPGEPSLPVSRSCPQDVLTCQTCPAAAIPAGPSFLVILSLSGVIIPQTGPLPVPTSRIPSSRPAGGSILSWSYSSLTTRARFHKRSSLCDPGSLLTQDRSTRRVKIVSTNVGSVRVKRSLGSILSHSRCLRNVCLSKVL